MGKLKGVLSFLAILLQIIIIGLLILKVSRAYSALLVIVVPLALLVYGAVLFALVLLRFKKPESGVSFGKAVPLVIILINAALVIIWLTHEGVAPLSLLWGAAIILMGILVCFLLDMYYDPKMMGFINDLFAEITLLTEKINLPVSVRKEIIGLVGNVKGKTILEFGCSVGTLTMHLADEVGPKGRVYATDISKRGIALTQKRLDKKGHRHVRAIHDIYHHQRIHPEVPKIHAVVSVGALGYLKKPENALNDINKRLKIGSKICFVDYDKFFDIIPTVDWLEDDSRIKELFKKSGFDVKIERKQGFAWKYIFIYGKKIKNVK